MPWAYNNSCIWTGEAGPQCSVRVLAELHCRRQHPGITAAVLLRTLVTRMVASAPLALW